MSSSTPDSDSSSSAATATVPSDSMRSSHMCGMNGMTSSSAASPLYLVHTCCVVPVWDIWVKNTYAIFTDKISAVNYARTKLYDLVESTFRGGVGSCTGMKFNQDEIEYYDKSYFEKIRQTCDVAAEVGGFSGPAYVDIYQFSHNQIGPLGEDSIIYTLPRDVEGTTSMYSHRQLPKLERNLYNQGKENDENDDEDDDDAAAEDEENDKQKKAAAAVTTPPKEAATVLVDSSSTTNVTPPTPSPPMSIYLITSSCVVPTYDIYINSAHAIYFDKETAIQHARQLLHSEVNKTFRGGVKNCTYIDFDLHKIESYNNKFYYKLRATCDTAAQVGGLGPAHVRVYEINNTHLDATLHYNQVVYALPMPNEIKKYEEEDEEDC